MKRPRITVDNSAQAAAQQAQAQANQAIANAQQAANNLQKNLRADLTSQNMATVIAGGTAEQIAPTGDFLKRKRQTTGLSSSLGINL